MIENLGSHVVGITWEIHTYLPRAANPARAPVSGPRLCGEVSPVLTAGTPFPEAPHAPEGGGVSVCGLRISHDSDG